MTIPAPSIGRQMATGAAWMVCMRLAVRSIGLVSTVILARLLVPEDFGLVALSTSLLFAIEVLGQFSFDLALIRDGAAGRSHYDTAWTLALIRGAVLGLLVAALAVPAAEFFGDPRLPPVICVLAATTFLEGFQNIGIVDFRRSMDFRREFTFTVLQKLFSFTATLAFALLWREYWALVMGNVFGRAGGVLLSYVMSRYRPRFSLAEWRSLLGFSKWLLCNNILFFLSSRLDVFILGRMFGAHELGIYNVSTEISALPTTELVWPIQRAIYPGLAKMAGDPDRLRRSYLDGVSILLMLAVPAAAGLAILADPFVRVLLGPQWLEVIALLQILALHGLVKLGGANAGSALLALGRPKVITQLAFLNLVLLGPALVAGIHISGLPGAAWAMVLVASVSLVFSYVVTMRILALPFRTLLAAMWRTWVSAAIMAGVVHALLGVWPPLWPEFPLLKLVAGIVAGACAYVVAHLALWWVAGRPYGAERMVLAAAADYMRRPRTAAGPAE